MKKRLATQPTEKGRIRQLVLNQTQVGLALGCVTISLMMAFGVGFIVGMWYQTSEHITPYNSGGPLPTTDQRAQNRPMTFYSTLTPSKQGSTSPTHSAGDGVTTRERHLQRPMTITGQRTAPLAGTRYSVQVGSFRGREQAERLRSHLAHKGYPVRVEPSTVPGKGMWYRVRVGHFSDRPAADKTAQRLVSQEHLSVIIADESP
jgi:cell division protein FtsN